MIKFIIFYELLLYERNMNAISKKISLKNYIYLITFLIFIYINFNY